MAPEQARGRNVDKRADIWAFGVILYEMLTGEQMFDGDTVTDVLAAVVRQDPDLKRVPEKVRPLLQRCLEKDPKRRLRDAGDAMLLLDSAPPPPCQRQSSRMPLLALGGVAALLALALGGVSYVHFREAPPAAEVMRFQVGLPESVNFTQFGTSAISPDGRKIAFAAYGYDGNPRVWIRSLDSATATPLEDTGLNQQTAALFWSPDSRFVAYGDSKQLRKIDITGGPSQALADIAPAIGGSWNADGTILVGSTRGILKLSANGGMPTPVTKPGSPQEAHAHPVFLPDGRHFLYMRGLPPGKRTIHVGDLNATPDAQSTTPILTNDYGVTVTQASAGGAPLVLFLRDGTLLAQEFDMSALALDRVAHHRHGAGRRRRSTRHSATSRSRRPERSCIDRSAGSTVSSRGSIGKARSSAGLASARPYGTMKVSPDGSKAVVVQNDPRQPGNSDLWIVDLTSGASTRFTFDPAFDGQPVWSPDGRYIAWQSGRGDAPDLYRKAADGSGVDERLGAPKDAVNLTDWTHNGYLIFTLGGDVHALPVEADASGKRTPVPVIQSPAAERGAYVSPDNRWIAYMSTETGRDEIYVQPFSVGGNKTSGKWMVSRGTRGMARWRADSKELMFVNGDGAIVAVDVAPGAAFQTQPPKKLFQMPLDLLSNQNVGTLADATRDAQRLLMVMPVQESAQRELAVVLNWQAGLAKVAAGLQTRRGDPCDLYSSFFSSHSSSTCRCPRSRRHPLRPPHRRRPGSPSPRSRGPTATTSRSSTRRRCRIPSRPR